MCSLAYGNTRKTKNSEHKGPKDLKNKRKQKGWRWKIRTHQTTSAMTIDNKHYSILRIKPMKPQQIRQLYDTWNSSRRGDFPLGYFGYVFSHRSCLPWIAVHVKADHTCKPNWSQMVRIQIASACGWHLRTCACAICEQFVYHLQQTNICLFFVQMHIELCAPSRQLFHVCELHACCRHFCPFLNMDWPMFIKWALKWWFIVCCLTFVEN